MRVVVRQGFYCTQKQLLYSSTIPANRNHKYCVHATLLYSGHLDFDKNVIQYTELFKMSMNDVHRDD